MKHRVWVRQSAGKQWQKNCGIRFYLSYSNVASLCCAFGWSFLFIKHIHFVCSISLFKWRQGLEFCFEGQEFSSFLSPKTFFFKCKIYVYKKLACIYVCTLLACLVPIVNTKCVGSSRTEVTDSCVLLCLCWVSTLGL